jgi:cyanuric acid amidohydrolase
VIGPEQLGRRAQVDAVAAAVQDAAERAGFAPEVAELVLVKCPLLTSQQIATDTTVVSGNPYASMGFSRAASALGVARATGEASDAEIDAALAGELSIYSSVASTSAGVEVDSCHVVVLGPSTEVRSWLRASHTVMADAIDATGVRALLEEIAAADGQLLQVFAKAEAAPDGQVRGRRHTMLSDSDLGSTRHARAAVGGLLAGLCGEPAIYVSGGAEHQGPPGGGPVTIVWRAHP